jgi:hypothetical protein
MEVRTVPNAVMVALIRKETNFWFSRATVNRCSNPLAQIPTRAKCIVIKDKWRINDDRRRVREVVNHDRFGSPEQWH